MRRPLALAALLAALLLAGDARPAAAALGVHSIFVGPFSVSISGFGSVGPEPKSIAVRKPATAAGVHAALLFWAATDAPTWPNVSLAANPSVRASRRVAVPWDSGAGVFHNQAADVTQEVAALLDTAAPGSEVRVPYSEDNDGDTEGAILAVIFKDTAISPDEPRSILLLFGGQEAGSNSTFDVTLGSPHNQSNALLLSLGTAFSFQGRQGAAPAAAAAAAQQASRLYVNGRLVSSAVGGSDDGAPENGALITVGGFNDSPVRPANAAAAPAGLGSDDELYGLTVLVPPGAKSFNFSVRPAPGNDDNLFFAAVVANNQRIAVDTELLVTLEPGVIEAEAGKPVTLTATVVNVTSKFPIPAINVSFHVIGAGEPKVAHALTSWNGTASFTLSSDAVGSSSVVASVVDSLGLVTRSPAPSVAWLPAAKPDFTIVSINPVHAHVPAGSPQTMVATVLTEEGGPVVAGVPLHFAVSGVTTVPAVTVRTSGDGTARFTFTSSYAGESIVIAGGTNSLGALVTSPAASMMWEPAEEQQQQGGGSGVVAVAADEPVDKDDDPNKEEEQQEKELDAQEEQEQEAQGDEGKDSEGEGDDEEIVGRGRHKRHRRYGGRRHNKHARRHRKYYFDDDQEEQEEEEEGDDHKSLSERAAYGATPPLRVYSGPSVKESALAAAAAAAGRRPRRPAARGRAHAAAAQAKLRSGAGVNATLAGANATAPVAAAAAPQTPQAPAQTQAPLPQAQQKPAQAPQPPALAQQKPAQPQVVPGTAASRHHKPVAQQPAAHAPGAAAAVKG